MSIPKQAMARFLESLEGSGRDVSSFRRHGLRYCLQVRVRSNLRMKARLWQDGFTPGSTVMLRAILTQNGLPADHPVTTVHATVTRPDRREQVAAVQRRGAGLYETVFKTQESGVYSFRIVATGRSSDGDRFRREQRMTAAVWHPLPERGGRYIARP